MKFLINSEIYLINYHLFFQTIKPNNCEFRIGNIREKLPFEDQSFDYIFIRNMAYTIVQTELPILFREVYRVLRPGGFVEMVEVDIETKRLGPQTKIGSSRSEYIYFPDFNTTPWTSFNTC